MAGVISISLEKALGRKMRLLLLLEKGLTGIVTGCGILEEIEYCRDLNEMVLCIQEACP